MTGICSGNPKSGRITSFNRAMPMMITIRPWSFRSWWPKDCRFACELQVLILWADEPLPLEKSRQSQKATPPDQTADLRKDPTNITTGQTNFTTVSILVPYEREMDWTSSQHKLKWPDGCRRKNQSVDAPNSFAIRRLRRSKFRLSFLFLKWELYFSRAITFGLPRPSTT